MATWDPATSSSSFPLPRPRPQVVVAGTGQDMVLVQCTDNHDVIGGLNLERSKASWECHLSQPGRMRGNEWQEAGNASAEAMLS